MISKADKNELRKVRHLRVRKKIFGTAERPRLCVYRSSKHIYAQLIDDVNGVTLAQASSMEVALRAKSSETTKSQMSELVGKQLAAVALEKGLKSVVFDRGGYIYHGRVMALAQGARQAGLEF